MNKLFLLMILFSSTALFADWEIETFTHEATGSTTQSAMIRNDEGFELAIFKTDEGYVWLDFSLSNYTFDEFAQQPLPRFQIDSFKPVQLLRGFVATIVPADEGIEAVVVSDSETISTIRDFSVNHIISERLPERVICPIFQGASRPHLDTIKQLSTGKQITFSFTLLDGSKGETMFTLKGAKKALDSIL
ncbi:MAG: hypothetical protein COA83_03265 [Methylophaga sp.]|nr:MAG: hypothetical protein COA83_03265 [Methylophaga sp.]